MRMYILQIYIRGVRTGRRTTKNMFRVFAHTEEALSVVCLCVCAATASSPKLAVVAPRADSRLARNGGSAAITNSCRFSSASSCVLVV